MNEKNVEEIDQSKPDVRAVSADEAVFFSKWILVMFWVRILMYLMIILSNDRIVTRLPVFMSIGIQIFNFGVAVAYSVVFIILSIKDKHSYLAARRSYLFAGITYLLANTLDMIMKVLTSALPAVYYKYIYVALFWSIVIVFISWVAKYYDYKGQSEVLYGVAEWLSNSWKKLWKWYIRIMIILLVSLCTSLLPHSFFQIMTLLLMIPAAIGALTIEIIQMVLLYKTSKALKAYSQMNESEDSLSPQA